jgi:hypothetical protein
VQARILLFVVVIGKPADVPRCFAAAEGLTHHPRMGTAALPKSAPAFTNENMFAINALSVRRIHLVRSALRV